MSDQVPELKPESPDAPGRCGGRRPSPCSALASEAWKGKRIRLVLLGKKHVNGARFTEAYDMEIESIKDPVCLAEAIAEALKQAETRTDIPADLVEGVEFRFMPNDQNQGPRNGDPKS